jgi:hypothetical protein
LRHGAVHYHAEAWGDEWHDNVPQNPVSIKINRVCYP